MMKALLFTLLFTFLGSGLFAQDALQEARRLSDRHDYQQSSSLLLTYIEEHPQRKYDLGRAWMLHSYNLLKVGELVKAKEANDRSLNLRMQLRSGDIAENYLQAAQISLSNNRPDDALVAAQQGMQMLIENPRLYADLNMVAAQALNLMGRFDEANRYFQTAREVLNIEVGTDNPAYGMLLRSGGRLLQQQGQYQAAFDHLALSYSTLHTPVEKVKSLLLAYELYWQISVRK